MPSLWGRKPVPLERSERTEIHIEKCGNLILGRATGGRGPVHSAGGCWRTFQGLPGNVKVDGNRRRATVSGRPETAAGPLEIVALKQPFVVCGKVRRVDEARRIAGNAQMQLDKSISLIRRFRHLIKN